MKNTTQSQPQSFPVTIEVECTFISIPPGSQELRMVVEETSTVAHVPMVRSADAPVAFRVRDLRSTEEIRLYQGQLYAREAYLQALLGPVMAGDDHFPAVVHMAQGSHQADLDLAREEALSLARGAFAGNLIVDGEVYTLTGEPRYEVFTSGLGRNHGGTSLTVAWEDNPWGVRADSYFRADDFDAALSYAIEVAQQRGDDVSATAFQEDAQSHRHIEVLIPEAVTLVCPPRTPLEMRNLQSDYSRARTDLGSAQNATQEATAFERVKALRSRILEAGFPLIEDGSQRPHEARPALPGVEPSVR